MPQSSHPLLRVPVPWVFVLNYLLGVALQWIAPLPFAWTLPVRADIVGGVLFVLGAALAGSGWFAFHRAGTTRVPGQVSTTFVSWGPYRMTRSMYVGTRYWETRAARQIWLHCCADAHLSAACRDSPRRNAPAGSFGQAIPSRRSIVRDSYISSTPLRRQASSTSSSCRFRMLPSSFPCRVRSAPWRIDFVEAA